MTDEISLITDEDRARIARNAEWMGDEPSDAWPYTVPAVLAAGAAVLALLAVATCAKAMPAHIHPNGPRMAALPANAECVARVEVYNLAGWYHATETVETDRGPVAIAYTTIGGHNASDHDRIEVVETPRGLFARPMAAQVRDGESLVVCLFEYVGG